MLSSLSKGIIVKHTTLSSETHVEEFQVAPCYLMIYEISLVRINIYIDLKVDSLFKYKGSLSL